MAPLKSYLNHLNADQLIKLAKVICATHPDCDFDTTVTAQQLRFQLDASLRSHPEWMENVPGLENISEFVTWSLSKETTIPEDQIQATAPAVVLQTPTVSHVEEKPKSENLPQTTGIDVNSIVATILQHTTGQQQQLIQQMDSQMQIFGDSIKLLSSKPSSSSGINSFLKQARSKSLVFHGSTNENLNRFLSKVDDLLQCFELSDVDQVRAVGDLLLSSAESWFESHRDTFSSWEDVKNSLKSTYLPRHHFIELRRKIITLRQGSLERVSDFLSKIRVMNSELDKPIHDYDLIPIVRANLHPKFLLLLGMKEEELDSWNKLEAAALRAESILQLQDQQQSQIDATAISDPNEELDIAAYRSSVKSELVCFNCQQKGHKHNECHRPKNIFCFKCGKHGVFSTQCDCRVHSNSNLKDEQIADIVKRVVAELQKNNHQEN